MRGVEARGGGGILLEGSETGSAAAVCHRGSKTSGLWYLGFDFYRVENR